MCAKHLREWLREHRAAEAASEVEKVGEMSEPEGWERTATAEGLMGGGEEREKTKWEKLVELVQLAFRDGVIVEEAAW